MSESILGKVVLKSGQIISGVVFDYDDRLTAHDLTDTCLHHLVSPLGNKKYLVQGSNIAYIEFDIEARDKSKGV